MVYKLNIIQLLTRMQYICEIEYKKERANHLQQSEVQRKSLKCQGAFRLRNK